MFKGNKNKSGNAPQGTNSTYIAEEIEITGNFKGQGAIQVEGIVHGDISVNSVVIGENGTINGTINAKNAIINGKLNGSIFCDTLEIMKNGNISNEIRVKQLLISGKVDGDVASKEDITVDNTGNVNATSMKSKNILVNGAFKGRIVASQLLHIGSTGSVEGEITVKNIKTDEGGKLLGSIHNYEEVKEASPKEAETEVAKA